VDFVHSFVDGYDLRGNVSQITSSDSVAAVPEPGSLILLSTVAAGVGFAAWRHSRNK